MRCDPMDNLWIPVNTTIDKTNQILHEVEDALGWPRDRRSQSYAALRGVLHGMLEALRAT